MKIVDPKKSKGMYTGKREYFCFITYPPQDINSQRKPHVNIARIHNILLLD
ncbi:hypothetical protein KsCSTR_43360 [Candidatus Kuenenia stuttgartiensis]|uniref:Uncharacterized protein n=1 Tax=Kuenenia stuttgartiensis TaxID=174633 RepID=Q1PX38_KUEST|nr:hypothetical protein KsCSTR_43360 [Candidatus Kuenenia stuttgartiensis]CAJ71798.1 unknown protein [Candidatus Kuenenia stuttgartiensis]